MFFISVIAVGIFSVVRLPIELSPEVEFPKLTVAVSWGNVSPEAMEALVTSQIESELAAVRGIKRISSTSSSGSSSINLEFYPETDMNFARVEINEKLAIIKNELPYGVTPPRLSQYIPDDFQDLQGFITYTISGSNTANDIRKIVKEKFVYQLKSIDGISDVIVRGGYDREINIIIDYDFVRSYEITNEEIDSAIRSAEIMKAAGSIRNGHSNIYVKLNNKLTSPAELENIIIKILPNQSAIKLKDIGKIIDDFKEPEDYYRINGQETIFLIINKEPRTNSIKLADIVKRKVDELGADLPRDMNIAIAIDKSEEIKNQLNELYSNGIYSFVIIIVILFLILRKLTFSLVIASSIIFSVMLSCILFYVFSLPLNIITIAAFIIGFGFMVDNSVVVIDYLDKHYMNNGKRFLTVNLKNIFLPVFASTLTTLGVFLPLLFFTGELKNYFIQFASGITFTLISSLIVCFTVIPQLYSKDVRKRNSSAFLFQNGQMYKIYAWLLSKMKLSKKLSIAFIILMIGLPVWLLPDKIENEFFGRIYNPVFGSDIYYEIKPYVNNYLGGALNIFFNKINRGNIWSYGESTYLYVNISLPNGNEIERINELTRRFEGEILAHKEKLKNVIASVLNEESASIKVEFTEEQSLSGFPYVLKNYLTAYAAGLGGLQIGVYGYGPGFFSGGGGSMSSYAVIFKGFNYNKVKELAEALRSIIIKNQRIDNVDIDRSYSWNNEDIYEVVASVNREGLKKYNILADEVFNIIAKVSAGNISWNKIRINNEEIEYHVKYTNYKKLQLENLKEIIIKNSDKEKIKVKDVLNFEEKKVMSSINREDQQYIRVVSFDFKGPYQYGNKFVEASLLKVPVPEGYSVSQPDYLWMFGEEDELEILKILIMAVVLIFMITASLFESVKKPILILTAIPFSMIGAVIAFYVFNVQLDRGGYAAMLLLIGLSVNNSIILVDYISNNYRGNSFDQIIRLSYTRLRPIFTTSLTTIGALIPFLFIESESFWKSLSVGITGGIFVSSLLVVLYLPLFWVICNNKSRLYNVKA